MSIPPESLQAFDRHSVGYARAWGAHPLARWMRVRVLAACADHLPPNGAILDIGCGPGLDAAALGAAGWDVTALDGSAGMVREASTRARRVLHLPMERLSELGEAGFDGALSNFGALNCVASIEGFGADLARLLRPGARAILVVMGPWCPAEDLALITRARRPFRRRRPVTLEGLPVAVRYLTTADLVRALPDFRLLHREALGALMAPPDLGGRVGRRARFEPYIAGLPLLRDAGDHQLLVFEHT